MGAVTAGKMTFSTERLEKTIHAEGSKNELSTIVSSPLFVTFSPYVLCQAADQPSWQKQLSRIVKHSWPCRAATSIRKLSGRNVERSNLRK